jgi:hypothetical protein
MAVDVGVEVKTRMTVTEGVAVFVGLPVGVEVMDMVGVEVKVVVEVAV